MRTKLRDAVNVNADSPLAFDPAEGGMEGTLRMGNPGGNTQLAYFIDPVNGNDNAAGISAPTAVKTEQEVINRIGGRIIPVAMTWHLLNDFGLDNPFYSTDKDIQFDSNGSLTVQSDKVLTTLATGTLTGATPISRAAGGGNSQQITDAALPVSWAAVGAINTATGACVRVRLANGAVAYGWKETGPKTLHTSPFFIPAATITGTPTLYVPVGNEAYTVETGFLSIADFKFFWSGNTVASQPRVFFKGEIALPNAANRQACVGSMNAAPDNGVPDTFLQACDVGKITPYNGIASVSCSKLSGSVNVISQGILTVGGSLITQNLQFQGSSGGGSFLQFDSLCALLGRLEVYTAGVELGNFAVFDNTNANGDGIRVFPGGSVRMADFLGVTGTVYGNGNTRVGINVIGTTYFDYQTNKPTITGIVGDTRFSGGGNNQVLSYAKIPYIHWAPHTYETGLLGAVTGGVTRFLAPNLTEQAASSVGFVTQHPYVCRNLRVRAGTAPGGAVVDAYSVTKNGAAQAVTANMTGAGTTATDTTNSFTGAASDLIEIQVVEGAGSVAANISASVEILPTDQTGAAIILGG